MKLNNVLHKSFLHEEYPEKVIIETSNNTLAVCDISHINTSAVGTQQALCTQTVYNIYTNKLQNEILNVNGLTSHTLTKKDHAATDKFDVNKDVLCG